MNYQKQDVDKDQKYGGKYIEESIDCPKCGTSFSRSYRTTAKKGPKQFCSRSCANSRDWKSHPNSKAIKEKRRNAALNNPVWIKNMENFTNNKRFSSKAERVLAENLGANFRRHKQVKLHTNRRIDVDIAHKTKDVWIESDGLFHFEKVHKNHDFKKSKDRDSEEEEYCLNNSILLIRVKNYEYSIDEQIKFVNESIKEWNGAGRIVKLY